MNQASAQLLREVEHAREGLLESFEHVSQVEMDYKPHSDVWSIGEVVHHLFLTESQVASLFGKMLERAKTKNHPIAKEDMPSQLKCLDAFSVDTPTVPAKAPSFSVPTHGISRDQLKGSIADSRRSLLAVSVDLCVFDLTEMRFPHPMLGKINMYQWLLCVGQHERRHTKQIEALKMSLHNQAL